MFLSTCISNYNKKNREFYYVLISYHFTMNENLIFLLLCELGQVSGDMSVHKLYLVKNLGPVVQN